MVRFGVGFIIIIIVLLSFERQVLNVATYKQEEAWANTGLKTQDIQSFYQNFNCKRTEKTFLACINGLQAMASYLHLTLKWSHADGLHLETKVENLSQKEKVRLSAWVEYFKNNLHMSMNFENVWKQLENKIQTHEFSAYIVGLGINNYLSIHRDPHSYILPREYYERIIANSQPRISSYGFVLGKSDTHFVFARVYPGSVFDKLGVSKGDLLLEVDGQAISKMDIETVSDWLRDKDQHQFKVKISTKIHTWIVHKKNQILPSVSIKKLNRANNKTLHLISVYKISEGVCSTIATLLKQAIQEKTGGVILDLRDNSGGSMDEVLCISGLFLGDMKIYDLVYFNKRFRKETFTSDQRREYFGPLVVLVNRSTASSAEILAGTIQYYKRGLIIGERTFGKGSFQEGEEWPKNKRLLYFQTKGTFHLPTGKSPQLIGILPDIEIVEKITSGSEREEDLYMYPIGNRSVREKVSQTTVAARECKTDKKEILTGDRLLGKAVGQIDCIHF